MQSVTSIYWTMSSFHCDQTCPQIPFPAKWRLSSLQSINATITELKLQDSCPGRGEPRICTDSFRILPLFTFSYSDTWKAKIYKTLALVSRFEENTCLWYYRYTMLDAKHGIMPALAYCYCKIYWSAFQTLGALGILLVFALRDKTSTRSSTMKFFFLFYIASENVSGLFRAPCII